MIVAFRKRSVGIFSTLIRLWTRSPYDHCEIVLKGNMMVSSIDTKGVRVIYLLDDLPKNVWDTVTIETSDDADHIVHLWVADEVGCKYDWLGILFCQVFKFGRQHKDRWFCSEFCLAAIQQLGLFPGLKPYKYSPGGLYKLLTAKKG